MNMQLAWSIWGIVAIGITWAAVMSFAPYGFYTAKTDIVVRCAWLAWVAPVLLVVLSKVLGDLA